MQRLNGHRHDERVNASLWASVEAASDLLSGALLSGALLSGAEGLVDHRGWRRGSDLDVSRGVSRGIAGLNGRVMESDSDLDSEAAREPSEMACAIVGMVQPAVHQPLTERKYAQPICFEAFLLEGHG